MRLGDLRRYVRPSSPEVPRIVVILSSDTLNSSSRPWVLGMELQQRDLATSSPSRRPGMAGPTCATSPGFYRAWIGGRVGQLDELTLTRITGTVQAALDL